MSLLRTAAEYVSRRITFKTHLPARFGRRPIYFSPGNRLGVLKLGEAKFEGYLLGFAERFVGPEDVVWDIGANMGMFAIPAAHRAKFTLCFEPDPFNLDLLHRTQAVNPDLRMDVLPVALADSIGIAKLAIPIRGRAANSLAGVNYGSQMGGVREHFSVMTVPADWVLERYPAPTFIKCDAEGSEAMILRGASKVLSDARPVIIIEMPSANAKESADIFKANDYVTMSAYGRVDPTNTVDDISETWDTLAIPKEKLAAMIGR